MTMTNETPPDERLKTAFHSYREDIAKLRGDARHDDDNPPLIFLDVETTGLSAAKQRVLEVSFARIQEPHGWETAQVKTFRFRATPAALAAAHPKALEVNGYRHDHPDWASCPVMGSPGAREAWEEVHAALVGATYVNQNVHFDRAFVWSEFFHHGLYAVSTEVEAEELDIKLPWQRRHVDVQTYSRAFAKQHKSKSWGLQVVYDLIGGPPLPPHRAEADVLRAMWVYGAGEQKFAGAYPVKALAQGCVTRLVGAGAGVTSGALRAANEAIALEHMAPIGLISKAFPPGSYPTAGDDDDVDDDGI